MQLLGKQKKTAVDLAFSFGLLALILLFKVLVHNDKKRFLVVAYVKASGFFLPTAFIFKGYKVDFKIFS